MAAGNLTDKALRALKPRDAIYRKADGGGLCIEVTPAGSKLWRYRYRFAGKATMISFGAWSEVSLSEARDRHAVARKTLRDGADPAAVRVGERTHSRLSAENSFRAIAKEWRGKAIRDKAPVTATKIDWQLSLIPASFQDRPIGNIAAQDVLSVLRPLEARGVIETAHRLRARIGQIFRYAIATGRADSDPTRDLRDALTPVASKSRAALTDPNDVAGLLLALESYEGQPVTKAALLLAPLVFVRPGNLRAMEWSELDFTAGEWRIPAGKMKVREAHVVPLAKQSIRILNSLQPLTGRGRYVFPSIRSTARHMSNNTINAALRRMGFDKDTMTGHGFRAMASTRLNELGWAPDVVERQLAHAERNKVRAAYNRAQYLAERRKMMQAWADYLDNLKAGGNVVPILRKTSGRSQ